MLETKQSFKEGVSPIPNTPPAPSAIHGSCKTIQYMDTTSCDRHLLEWSAGWTNHSKECKSQYCGSRKTQLMWQKQACTSMFPESFTYNNIRYRQSPLCCSWSSLQSLYTVYSWEFVCPLPSVQYASSIQSLLAGGSHLCSILPVSLRG